MNTLEETAAALRNTASRLARRLRAESGQAEYSSSQVAVITQLLESGPATTSGLARAHEMRPQSMSAIIAGLEEAGIVGRRADPDDGRALQVFITEDGERSILESRAIKQAWLIRTMSERLTADEHDVLRRAADLIDRMLRA